jgi:hypothetical protein
MWLNVEMAAHKDLTNEQIRVELEKRKEKTIQLGLDFLALQEALYAKGVLTPEDMAQATQKVAQQAKEAAARVVSAMQKKPPQRTQ